LSRKIPQRKLPDFKLTDEQIEEKKAISAITNMLAEDPELIRNVINEMRAR
jgi:hypothetical protein